MLDSDDMEKIIADEVNGAAPRITGQEADEFREKLKPDLARARERGWVVEIPPEIQG